MESKSLKHGEMSIIENGVKFLFICDCGHKQMIIVPGYNIPLFDTIKCVCGKKRDIRMWANVTKVGNKKYLPVRAVA